MSERELAAPQPADPPPARPWVLYLLECAGERLYAGITNDLAARFQAHVDGRGARFTRAFAPLRIVAAAQLPSRSEALKAEHALKQQPRSKKLRFLEGCGTPLALDAVPATRSLSRTRAPVIGALVAHHPPEEQGAQQREEDRRVGVTG